MARTVSVGTQDFEEIISNNCFYVDKTLFIKEWWESKDKVSLITRPRRFGKTLNMNMVERFFSVKFEGKGEVFEGLDIWKEEKYRGIQGTYPVIFFTFADVKQDNLADAVKWIKSNLWGLYEDNRFLLEGNTLSDAEKKEFRNVIPAMDDITAQDAIRKLMKYLSRYYGKKVILVLDEYDTPLQEAYAGGYWKEIVSFTRSMFNSMFKTNPYLERAVMTGITRVSKESLFSDLNNLKVLTITSNKYSSYFGFTEEEVFAAMDEFGMKNKEEVKQWYDGFTIGNLTDIYNPWSIINFLDEDRLRPYWVNTSSNKLVSDLVREGDKGIKMQFERLLLGKTIWSEIDEEVGFDQLYENESGIWSLLLVSGYLKTVKIEGNHYELALTNFEVKQAFEGMVKGWFSRSSLDYNGFIKALLRGNLKEMNAYMKRVSLSVFSSFDGGTHPSEFAMPEKFYHGFVLGLLVNLMGRYELTSNRESGFGRYDVMLRPLNKDDDAILMEFKVYDADEESSLEETVQAALKQIEEKAYEQILIDAGIEKERIRRYGFAFEGKKVLIGE
ncbi:MAG: AAA family ATPase [Lachnospiraceae bacterium]|nr:AAA family ATPase [Lachnospiraceae bacterium]